MKTKEEVIKEAWGIHYNKLEKFIDSDGKINNNDLPDNYCTACIFVLDGTYDKIYEDKELYFRPKSLQGIENNNGWISIKSEGDLPKEEIDVHFIFKNTKGRFQSFGVWDNKLKSFYSGALKIRNVTHYQPITKPEPPLHE